MLNYLCLYASSIIIIVWGVAHIIPTQAVLAGFGSLSQANKRILTMEWVAEGLALCFIGVLTLLVTFQVGSANSIATLVYRASAGMLVVMAIWTAVTGARTSIVPIKICPWVKTAAAVLLLLGTLL
jgi:hypothetical protein